MLADSVLCPARACPPRRCPATCAPQRRGRGRHGCARSRATASRCRSAPARGWARCCGGFRRETCGCLPGGPTAPHSPASSYAVFLGWRRLEAATASERRSPPPSHARGRRHEHGRRPRRSGPRVGAARWLRRRRRRGVSASSAARPSRRAQVVCRPKRGSSRTGSRSRSRTTRPTCCGGRRALCWRPCRTSTDTSRATRRRRPRCSGCRGPSTPRRGGPPGEELEPSPTASPESSA